MGLDDFKTSGSSSSSGAGSTASSGNTGSKLNSVQGISGSGDSGPHFNAIIKRETEEVKCFFGDEAFRRASRHRGEKFLTHVDTEEEFEYLNDRCQKLHGCSVDELFQKDPYKASDFVDRLDPEGADDEEVDCAICDETIIITEDKYTKVEGELVHASHRVDEVAEELDVEV